ncbi:DUF1223 domain-containing protein [Phenylobacterium sp.]|uniref:DUF1223 domain-containing protein n=1 Tax=Phenylobacterium sp. TaxID=1871053 RepID=UPI00286A05EF|nr:DUF1223 domain-containing protein [Phenylobacterium sp.]
MRTAALLCLTLFATPGMAVAAKPPVVVELFTAQGCASCGEANSYVGKLSERPGVLALTFPVDYWDYLGWADTFAKPEFSDRQKAYVTRLALRESYTPQVVVDGRAQAGGLQTDKVDKLLTTAAGGPRNPPDMAFIGPRRVDVGSGAAPRGGADVWLVRYDPRDQDVVVRKGDNRGQTVAHKNVVREIKRLGSWRGRPTAYRLPPPTEEGLATAVLVQSPDGGRILGVAMRDAPN